MFLSFALKAVEHYYLISYDYYGKINNGKCFRFKPFY